ncbi:hypothetical protein CJF32_00005597 [Rutstroemia sp. NJR-2017a WRK4]|nr:hypothetical protein CJF32_00005597 [Rutstroemia sp. NJR-2017a WRK4]
MAPFSSDFHYDVVQSGRPEHPLPASAQGTNVDEMSRLRKRVAELEIALQNSQKGPDCNYSSLLGILKPPTAQQNNPRPDAIPLSDPHTPAGQTPGALLLIMQLPIWPSKVLRANTPLAADVGDIVRYIGPTKRKDIVKVKHFRTGEEGILMWRSFQRVNTRNLCTCQKANCYCLYENFRASENFVDKFDEYQN